MLRAHLCRAPECVGRAFTSKALPASISIALSALILFSAPAMAQGVPSAIEWPVVRQQASPPTATQLGSEQAGSEQAGSDQIVKPADTEATAPVPAGVQAATTGAPTTETSSAVIISAVRTKLDALPAGSPKSDVDAAVAFYESASAPLWVTNDGLSAKAAGVIKTLETAADWGLEASAFSIPRVPPGPVSPEELANAEVNLTLSALKYARFARGGRLDPGALSRILDQKPPVKDAQTVMGELAASNAPYTYLTDQHPKHAQFELLRQALLKSRGPAEPEQAVDEALLIKLRQGKILKKGMKSGEVVSLRKRLKTPAESGESEDVFDERLSQAVATFQVSKGLTPTGNLTNGTRTALNAEGAPKKSSPKQTEQRIVINMEKWRWMPEDLGSPYVWNNVPDFQTRTIKDGKVLFQEKIIAGMPEWATPVFTAHMEFVIFNPTWGVPDGIKTRELQPRLQKAGGGGFFDQLFGGGGGKASVMKAYGLTAYRNGKPVDPSSINPNEIRSYSFVQPAGAQNPLGIVKFRYPNKHDVYMHDTTQRNLFAQSYRAMSHGCIRVQNPMRFAEVLLNEDRGWSPERVKKSMGQGEITLTKKIPVHTTYFTAVVDDAGRVNTFADLYGHDSKISSALGRAMNFDGGNALETASISETDRTASISSTDDVIPAPAAAAQATGAAVAATKKPTKKELEEAKKRAAKKSIAPDSLSDAVSGLLNN